MRSTSAIPDRRLSWFPVVSCPRPALFRRLLHVPPSKHRPHRPRRRSCHPARRRACLPHRLRHPLAPRLQCHAGVVCPLCSPPVRGSNHFPLTISCPFAIACSPSAPSSGGRWTWASSPDSPTETTVTDFPRRPLRRSDSPPRAGGLSSHPARRDGPRHRNGTGARGVWTG